MSFIDKYLKYKYKYLELKQTIQNSQRCKAYLNLDGGSKESTTASGGSSKRGNSNTESSDFKKVKFYGCNPNLIQDNTSGISRADSGPNLKDSMLRRLISNISNWLTNLLSIKKEIKKEKKDNIKSEYLEIFIIESADEYDRAYRCIGSDPIPTINDLNTTMQFSNNEWFLSMRDYKQIYTQLYDDIEIRFELLLKNQLDYLNEQKDNGLIIEEKMIQHILKEHKEGIEKCIDYNYSAISDRNKWKDSHKFYKSIIHVPDEMIEEIKIKEWIQGQDTSIDVTQLKISSIIPVYLYGDKTDIRGKLTDVKIMMCVNIYIPS